MTPFQSFRPYDVILGGYCSETGFEFARRPFLNSGLCWEDFDHSDQKDCSREQFRIYSSSGANIQMSVFFLTFSYVAALIATFFPELPSRSVLLLC